MSLDSIDTAYRRVKQANERLALEVATSFPVGSRTTWEKMTGAVCGGEVIDVYGERLKVRNSRTGKEYWIEAYHILKAHGKI